MTSKVLVKLPTVPFSQGKKSAPELVSLPARNDGSGNGANTPHRSQQGINGDRTAQLEQNMKFLQDQHQATLIALHQEVEVLRQRNRDLQFQLVFTKGTSNLPTPSSPEDNTNGFVKTKGSPVCVNVTPLQIELLERDLEELKTSFNEAKKENQYLQEVLEKQKLKLEQTDKQKNQLQMSDVGVQVGDSSESIQNDLTARLEDAEAMVKRLRRENADQQKEIATIKASSARNGNRNGHGHGRGRGNENGHHSRGSSGDAGQPSRNSYKFPPLEGDSYWRNAGRGRSSYEHSSGQHNRRNRLEKEVSEPDMAHAVGPGIVNPGRFSSYDHPLAQRHRRIRPDKDDNETNMSHVVFPELQKRDLPCYPPFYQTERGYRNGGGNYYRDGGNRKFRGQQRHRDRGDHQDSGRGQPQQSQQHRNDYKDRNNSKDHSSQQHQRNFTDSAHTSKKQ